MNHDKLRQQAEATLNHAYSSAEYILASAVLEILDEIVELRSALIANREEARLRWVGVQKHAKLGFEAIFDTCNAALGDAS